MSTRRIILDTDVASLSIKNALSPALLRGLLGRSRPQNDSWIAACCLAYDLPLATLNVKDFADFAEYEGLRIVGHEDG